MTDWENILGFMVTYTVTLVSILLWLYVLAAVGDEYGGIGIICYVVGCWLACMAFAGYMSYRNK